MIVIRVLLKVKPEEKQNFVSIFKTHVTDSRKFDGCVQYGIFEDIQDDHTYILYEEWETRQNFDHYRNSDYFKQSGEKIFPMIEGSPTSAYFTAEAFE